MHRTDWTNRCARACLQNRLHRTNRPNWAEMYRTDGIFRQYRFNWFDWTNWSQVYRTDRFNWRSWQYGRIWINWSDGSQVHWTDWVNWFFRRNRFDRTYRFNRS